MFKDFGRRLQQDLKIVVDRRIQNSEAAAGTNLKASHPVYCRIWTLTDRLWYQSTGVDVNVISHKRQRLGFSWLFFSLFA
jgi:actin-related protein